MVKWVSPEAEAVYGQWTEIRDAEIAKYQRRAERVTSPRQAAELQREMNFALEQANKVLVKLYVDFTVPDPTLYYPRLLSDPHHANLADARPNEPNA